MSDPSPRPVVDASAPIRRIAVCVPVRNEEALLPRLLHALAAQRCGGDAQLTLCFLLNGCHDRSAGILADAATAGGPPIRVAEVEATDALTIGHARHAAMLLGRDAVGGDGALLTTDADSVPAPSWVEACRRALAGADVVAGRIVREAVPANPVQDRLELYYDRLYALRRRIDPLAWEDAPGHHHVGGASMGFRAAAYDALGGFPAIAAGEDGAIVDAAHRLGLRVRRDAAALVTTSARRHGRVEGGLATHLDRLARRAALPLVAHPDDAIWQYLGHVAARAAYPHIGSDEIVARLAGRLGVERAHVRRIAEAAPNAEGFATLVVPAAPGHGRMLPLDAAEVALARATRAAYDRAA